MKSFLFALALCPSLCLSAQQSPVTPQAILERTKAATVIILAGEGAGRLHSIATGVLITKNGIVLTALHAVKGAAEVQVRLANGEVFDHVAMLGSDERRDVAAISISASSLPFLTAGSTSSLVAGDPVYAVSNADGLTWSASEGILSAIRPADQVPGAGTGFRLLQFTAPVAHGSSGGALVSAAGDLIGIITAGQGNAAFAVPIDSVLGLAASGQPSALGSGAALQLPVTEAVQVSQATAAIANSSPAQILKSAKNICVQSKTSFLTVDTLDRALVLQKDWSSLGLTLVQDPRVADLLIQLDRPLFTYVHTFVIVDKKTSIVLGSGKVTAFDGTAASGTLAKDIVKIFAADRLTPTPKS